MINASFYEKVDADWKYTRQSFVYVEYNEPFECVGFYMMDWMTGHSSFCPVSQSNGYYSGQAF